MIVKQVKYQIEVAKFIVFKFIDKSHYSII